MPSQKKPAPGKDLTIGIEYANPAEKTHFTTDDGVPDDYTPSVNELLTVNAAKRKDKNSLAKHGKGNARLAFQQQWPNVLKCAENGYEYTTICKAFGWSLRTFMRFLQHNPDKKKELAQARLAPRDMAVQVILNAARKGQWLPAAWWLERTCWQEFARPEVKLQLMDRVLNQNEVVQTFNGKSLAQINSELREKYAQDPNFQRSVEYSRSQVAAVRSKLDNDERGDNSPEGGSAVVDNPPNDVLD